MGLGFSPEGFVVENRFNGEQSKQSDGDCLFCLISGFRLISNPRSTGGNPRSSKGNPRSTEGIQKS
jgi:hypothetical protein